MRDSFNNELQVGDKILCLDAGIYTSHRINQIGSVAQILQDRMIVNFDLADTRDWGYPELNVPSGHGNCLILDQGKFIKLETHEEVEYREGDRVLCYCPLDNDYPFEGRVVRKLANSEEYEIVEHRNSHILTKSEILFLLERREYKVGDEIVIVEDSSRITIVEDYTYAVSSVLYDQGYNQSIPARIDSLDSDTVVIEMDDPVLGWGRDNDHDHSYWTFLNTKRLFPKEFSYSLPFVQYLELRDFGISSEQINFIEENRTVSNELRSRQLINSFEQLDLMSRGRRVSNEPRVGQVNPMEKNRTTPKLIHNYNYKPSETHFCINEDEERNENNLYLGIELEISGSSQESDNEEDAREIMKVFQKDIESPERSLYFKHDGSINGFEIVFHPHTIKAYNEYNWKEIFSTIRKLGYTNDDRKAGCHVHISRKYFGNTTQQNEALAKLVFLMYKFKEEIEPLAGRKDSDYATYSAKALKRAKENDLFGTFRWYSDSCGKYSAVNCQHKDTFEIRIFNGVTDKVRFKDILNFIENLCNIVKNTSPMDITKVGLEDFMPFLFSIER